MSSLSFNINLGLAVGCSAIALCSKNKGNKLIVGFAAAIFAGLAYDNYSRLGQTCEDQLRDSLELIKTCPAAKNLWDQVEQEGFFNINCVSKYKVATGSVKLSSRTISVSVHSDSTEPMVETILFELNNLKQSKKFLELDNQTCSMSPKNYATEIEKIEYSSGIKTQETMNQCSARDNWPTFNNFYDDFETCLEAQINSGHTSHIIEIWHEYCDGTQSKTL